MGRVPVPRAEKRERCVVWRTGENVMRLEASVYECVEPVATMALDRAADAPTLGCPRSAAADMR